MFKSKSLLFLFSLEALAIAAYAWQQFITVFTEEENIHIFPSIILLPVFIFLCALALLKLITWTSQNLSRRTGLSDLRLLRSFLFALSPFLLLYLVFLQYVFFLKDIRGYLFPISLLGSAYLMAVFLSRLKRVNPQAITFPKFIKALNPNRFAPKRLSLFVFLSALIVYAIFASGLVFPPQPFTGDEPHYLIITKSILKDGDINLFNNYEDKDYLEYYPGDLRSHAFRGKKGDDYQYSRHLPALSMLVLPAFYLGEKAARLDTGLTEKPETKRQIIVFAARFPMCVLTALVGLMFFFIARDMTQRQDAALLAWAVSGFTTPVLFYSHLIYPEIPAALIAMFVFRCMILRKALNPPCIFLSAMGIALLPWFGVKFIALSAVLFLVSMFAFRGSKIKKKWGKLPIWLAPLIFSTGMYLCFLWSLYGSFAPSSVYRGAPLDSSTPVWLTHFLKSDFLEFFNRVVGYFLDQRFGIFIYTPVYILGIAGLFYIWKQKKREAMGLVFIFSVFGIFSAYYYWGGYCPPGRPMIPVIWIFALFMAFSFMASSNPARSIVKRVSIALSFFMVWKALDNPWILYHENSSAGFLEEAGRSNLLTELSNTFINLEKMFPLLGREATQWIPLAVWMIAVALIVIVFMKKTGKMKPVAPSLHMASHLTLVFCLSLIVLAYVFFDIHLDRKDAFEGRNYRVFFQDTNHHGHELGGFWTKGKRKTAIVLKSSEPLSRIALSLTGRIEGRTEIQAGRAKMKIERTKEGEFTRTVSFSPQRGFPMGGGYLYYLTIEDSSGFIPFKLDRNEQDNRYLGVFVQIAAHPQNHP